MGLADLLTGHSIAKKKSSEIKSDLMIIISDLQKLEKNCRILVFGSTSRGEATNSSDYDIAVILPNMVDKKDFRQKFYAIRSRIHTPVDIIFRTESEFTEKQKDNLIDQSIANEGVEIYPKWNLHD